jgi:hypothetical protein
MKVSPDIQCVHVNMDFKFLSTRTYQASGITPGCPVTQEKSRNNPELLCNLAFGVWNLRLPQFDRISLRVMHAGKPAVGIRLRVNLDLDSRSL